MLDWRIWSGLGGKEGKSCGLCCVVVALEEGEGGKRGGEDDLSRIYMEIEAVGF